MPSRKARKGTTDSVQRERISRRDIDRFRVIRDRLRDEYGAHHWTPADQNETALDQLIGTVLSQHTSDVNTARAYRSLRDRFPTWEDVRTARTEDVADAIRSGGLAAIKAPRIQRILDDVLEREGELSLERLRQEPTVAATAELTSLVGVGPKTAACVLMFNLGRPSMPVDTHVQRVSGRLGLGPEGASTADVQGRLEALAGDQTDDILTLHLNLIQHGRRICRARNPLCEACLLADVCPWFQTRQEGIPG